MAANDLTDQYRGNKNPDVVQAINAIAQAIYLLSQNSGGSGLSPTGSDVGATSQAQVFTTGVNTNFRSTAAGALILRTSTAGLTELYTSDSNHSLFINGNTHNANFTLPAGSLQVNGVDVALSNGAKVYNISITQTGTDAPVITVYENNLGGTPVSSYEDVGDYRITLAGAFPIGKTFIVNQSQAFDDDGDAATYTRVRAFGDYLNILSLDALNGGNNKEIESSIPLMIGVLVYP